MSWDVIVVGAGPAGSSAAIAARRTGLSVLLLERAALPRDKICGDGIAPHVFDALEQVGVHGLVDDWTPLRELRIARGTTRRPAAGATVWVVPREVFDARLVERAVDAGAELRRHRVREVVAGPHDVRVDGLAAGVVVGADGASSVVRRAAGLGAGRRALALRGYAPTPPGRRHAQVIVYGDRRQPSYAWAFDRGDGLSNVGYGELVADARGELSRDVLMAELERLLPGAAEGGTGWRGHHLPLSGWRWSQPDGRLLLAGDAAGLVNPMTGEGIYYAVATGLRAGRAAAHGPDAGRRYRRSVRAHLATHLRNTFVASRLSASPRVVDAGIRASARRQPVFDDLVEIGLGRGTITGRLALGLVRGLGRIGVVTESVVLLDDAGNALGTAPKASVHTADTPLHLAFSVYLFDGSGRFLLTRRALHKRTWPGVWTNSACGHPAPGEQIHATVRRRVRQELGVGLDGLRLLVPRFRYRAVMSDGTVEHEMCPVFAATTHDEPTPDPEEVESAVWVDWAELRRGVLDGSRDVSPWCREQLAVLPEQPWLAPAADPAELPPAAR